HGQATIRNCDHPKFLGELTAEPRMVCDSNENRMTQEDWLIRYIENAFQGVRLDEGIDIHTAESMDDYGNPAEDRLSLSAERTDWRLVAPNTLSERHCGVTFLDAKGFRFYSPAIMTAIVNQDDGRGLLLDSFLANLKVSIHGKIKDADFSNLFTKQQRAAIIRFLKFLVDHGGRNA
ncbi:MAG: DUF6714 family protein, partial [Verrucomicrobiota bacterium]